MKKVIVLVLALMGVFMIGTGSLMASELDAGKTFFENKRCAFCHTIEGKGGKMASDLSKLGSKRNRAWLMKFFKNPKKLANAKMPPVSGSPEELSALADYLLSQK